MIELLPKYIAVQIEGTPNFAIVTVGESGWRTWPDGNTSFDKLDTWLSEHHGVRRPTPQERAWALWGAIFGWNALNERLSKSTSPAF